MISKKINQSNTVLWNGPAGYFENDFFAKGTIALLSQYPKIHQGKTYYQS